MAPEDERPAQDEDVYHLDIESDAEADADAVAREALEAIAARQAEQGEEEGGGGRSGDPASSEADVAQLESELAELRDRSIRTLADFENFRRRAEREREDLKRFGTSDVLRDLLPVVDNLERAIAAGGRIEDLKLGVEMTLRQFKDLLRQRGLVEVKASGEPFDPTVHEAVAREEDPGVSVATVSAELQRGYTLNGRLLRPALVRVAVPVEGDRAQDGTASGSDNQSN